MLQREQPHVICSPETGALLANPWNWRAQPCQGNRVALVWQRHSNAPSSALWRQFYFWTPSCLQPSALIRVWLLRDAGSQHSTLT